MRTQRIQVRRRRFAYVVYPLAGITVVCERPSKFQESELMGPVVLTAVPEGKREAERVIRKELLERIKS